MSINIDHIYYNQGDSRWGQKLYSPNMTYAEGGCGPTSIAMAVSKVLGNPEITPVDVGDYICSIGGVTDGQGTNWNAIPLAVQHFGFKCEQLFSHSEYGTSGMIQSRKTFCERVSQDRYSGIDLFGPGYHTRGGHYTHCPDAKADGSSIYIYDVAYPPRNGWKNSYELANENNAPGYALLGKPFRDWTQKGLYTIDYGEVPAIGGKSFKLPQVSIINGSFFNGAVVILQRLLVSYGFLNLAGVDGYFGPDTQAALKNYQKKFGLKVDGICGPKTWESILGVPGKVSGSYFTITVNQMGFGKTPSEPDPYVKLIQRFCKGICAHDPKAGLVKVLYSGEIDGWYGNDTTKAVAWFQEISKLNKDGICGPKTLNVFFGGLTA